MTDPTPTDPRLFTHVTNDFGCDLCDTCEGCSGCADDTAPLDLARGDCEACGACGPCVAACRELRIAEMDRD